MPKGKQGNLEYKSVPAYTKQIEERTVTGFAAVVGNIDSGRDRIMPGAFAKTISEGQKRVRHLWMHDSWEPPTAKIEILQEVGTGDLTDEMRKDYPEALGALLVKRTYLDTPRGNEILAGLKAGAINEMSFGYDAIKKDYEEVDGFEVRNLRELRLWDTSDVNWGMNPATVAVKSTVKFASHGVETGPWQAPQLSDFTDQAWDELSEAEKRRITAHFAYALNNPAESFDDLQFAHHSPSKDGVGPSNWRGVASAMIGFMGANDLPSADRKEIHQHLAQHYQEHEQDAPKFEVVQLASSVSAALRAVEADGDLKTKLVELNHLLRAEPLEALTPWGMKTRIEIAERELLAL